mgnify:CR=1 FL=1
MITDWAFVSLFIHFHFKMKYAIFLCGSAGAGKSTTTNILKTHFEVCKQHVTVFNFDPAANYLPYEPDFDIRDLITVNEV